MPLANTSAPRSRVAWFEFHAGVDHRKHRLDCSGALFFNLPTTVGVLERSPGRALDCRSNAVHRHRVLGCARGKLYPLGEPKLIGWLFSSERKRTPDTSDTTRFKRDACLDLHSGSSDLGGDRFVP